MNGADAGEALDTPEGLPLAAELVRIAALEAEAEPALADELRRLEAHVRKHVLGEKHVHYESGVARVWVP